MRRARVHLAAANAATATLPGIEAAKGVNKYHARLTLGIGPTGAPRTYQSKAEATWAVGLNRRQAAGEIRAWVPQVSLETGIDEKGHAVRYVADALIVLELREDGSFLGRLADRKGMDTPLSRAKRAALRSLYGLNVEVVP
jgi:hypothetical protein